MQVVGTNGKRDGGSSAGAPNAAGASCSSANGSSTDRSTSSHQRGARHVGPGQPDARHRSLSHDGAESSLHNSCSNGSHEQGRGREYALHSLNSETGSAHARGPIMDFNTAFAACVKVFCTSVAPCYALPWVRGEESHTTGSGFAVVLPSGERRLLTHAQVLENHWLVQVRRASGAQKYVAQVVCVGYDVDIAILNVEDEQVRQWRYL